MPYREQIIFNRKKIKCHHRSVVIEQIEKSKLSSSKRMHAKYTFFPISLFDSFKWNLWYDKIWKFPLCMQNRPECTETIKLYTISISCVHNLKWRAMPAIFSKWLTVNLFECTAIVRWKYMQLRNSLLPIAFTLDSRSKRIVRIAL